MIEAGRAGDTDCDAAVQPVKTQVVKLTGSGHKFHNAHHIHRAELVLAIAAPWNDAEDMLSAVNSNQLELTFLESRWNRWW